MQFKSITASAALCALVLVAGAAVWISTDRSHDQPEDLLTTLGRGNMPEEVHLYSGERDPETGNFKTPADRGKLFGRLENGHLAINAQMVQSKDGSFSITDLAAEPLGTLHPRKLVTREYFAPQPDENFWRLHSQSFFMDDGSTLKQDEVLHLDGTPERYGIRHEDGAYEITTYYEDGETVKMKRLTPPNNDTGDPLREEQFRPKEEGNYLLSSNLLNEDGSRTITEYSTRKNYPWKITQTGQYGNRVIGTTIRAWYPGTDHMRLDAEVTSYGTKAEFYRFDGTLMRKMRLGLYSHEDKFYAADGKTLLYEQWWNTERSIENHQRKVVDTLVKVTEYEGGKKDYWRVIYFDAKTGRVQSIVKQGPPENFNKSESFYRVDGSDAEIGTLSKTTFMRTTLSTPTVKEFTAAQNIRADIPKDEIAPPDMSDDLPIAPPTRMGPR